MRARHIAALVAAALLAAIAIARYGVHRVGRPNLLLITLDTTRADYVGCYGRASARTPALDALARDGIRFSRAFCNVPLTLPSHATIMTGLHPPEHGVRANGGAGIGTNVATLAEALAARGYQTAAFTAAAVLDARFGLDRGFDVYDDYGVPGELDARDEMALIRYRRGDAVADAALAWLKRRSDKPFFCWVHFFDPHRPYYLDEPLDPPDPIRAYEMEIAFMDRQIARLLDYLRESDLLDTTIVVAVGDHGEGLNQHGEDEHGLLLYDEVMRVPLIVRLPAARARGTTSDATVSLVDIAPTLLDLLHLSPPAAASGQSVAPALRGESIPDIPVYLETEFPLTEYGWSPLCGILRGNWKYVRAPREELYDLSRDPRETNNLSAAGLPELADLRDLLTQMERQMEGRASHVVKLDAATRRTLESLGYVGSGGNTTEGDRSALRDPKDAVWMRREFMDAQKDAREGRPAKAEGTLRRLVAASPESMAFSYKLGKLFFDQNRFEEAARVFEDMANRFAGNYAPHYDLGKTRIKLGQYDAAIAALGRAAAIDDDHVDVHNNLGLAHLYKSDLRAATKAFRRSIAIDPRQVDPHNNLGHVLLQMDQVDPAIAEFRTALDADRDAVGPRYNLGLALMRAARYREAAEAFRQVMRANPDFADVRKRLDEAVRNSSPTDPERANRDSL